MFLVWRAAGWAVDKCECIANCSHGFEYVVFGALIRRAANATNYNQTLGLLEKVFAALSLKAGDVAKVRDIHLAY